MFKKIFVFLLVQFIAFYPVLTPLANASSIKGDIEGKGIRKYGKCIYT